MDRIDPSYVDLYIVLYNIVYISFLYKTTHEKIKANLSVFYNFIMKNCKGKPR